MERNCERLGTYQLKGGIVSIEQIIKETDAEISLFNMIRFLYRYGYFNGIIDGLKNKSFEDVVAFIRKQMPEFKEAIKRFQDFYSLTVDADPGPQTQRAMMEPRCGCPDIIPAGAEGAGKCRWPIEKMNGVSYSCNFDELNLSTAEATRIFQRAADEWNKVCNIGLTFSNRYGTANINAETARIDQRGGTLAWSYLPCQNSPNQQLQQRYDTRENWSELFLLGVAVHELGHALGWNHANTRESILWPSYQRGIYVPQKFDIARAVNYYGEPQGKPDEPTEPTDPNNPTASGVVTVMIGGASYPIKMVSVTDKGSL